jgi:hypothetical protein
MSGKTMDFSCKRLYKAAPDTFSNLVGGAASGAGTVEAAAGGGGGWGVAVSWASATVAATSASAPQQARERIEAGKASVW